MIMVSVCIESSRMNVIVFQLKAELDYLLQLMYKDNVVFIESYQMNVIAFRIIIGL